MYQPGACTRQEPANLKDPAEMDGSTNEMVGYANNWRRNIFAIIDTYSSDHFSAAPR